MTFGTFLGQELTRRQAQNARYSLRAFARFLGSSHSTLSRVLTQRQRPDAASMGRWGKRLGLSMDQIRRFEVQDRISALCVLSQTETFRADARWIAMRLNLSIDDVQLTLHEALRQHRLTLLSPRTWVPE